MGKNQHVVPKGNKWAIKGASNEKYTKITDTQKDTIEAAKEIAKNNKLEVTIHRKNGQIRDKSSYGNDTFPPKG